MGKTLVLAEKPSVARDIARVLNCSKKGKGFLEGDKYVVTWALGHLVTLAEPEGYNMKYKAWRLEDLPILPQSLKLVVIPQSSGQFKTVSSQMDRKDVKEIVIATDAGREGELVARWIIEKAGIHKPLKRLWISSVTDKAIKEGFDRLKDAKEYEKLYYSAAARAEADWLVGINATRTLTCKFNTPLSCGRVQTPTLAIIAQREREINSFTPTTFYGIAAESGNLKLVWQDAKTKSARISDIGKCNKIIEMLSGRDAVITEISKSRKKTFSPRLYDLTELQRDANKAFGFSAKETLSIMQRLYENHKILTYPRTDSRYISSDIADTLKDRLKACSVGPYSRAAVKVLKRPVLADRSFIDDSKVSDHHAIIPTEQPVDLHSLNQDERKVYDLVVKRFISVLYPPYEYEQTTITASIGGEVFTAKGKIIISLGWKEVYSGSSEDGSFEDENLEDENPEQLLPDIKKGDVLKINSVYRTTGQTKPPAPFNEATLLSAMENPVKYMAGENKDLIKAIGEAGGIGTVATRADIIEKLFNSFLIEKKGKDIFITSKGRQLLELVPEELKSPALTAQWERKLGAISKGDLNKEAFISDMRNYAKAVVDEIKKSREQFKHDNLTMNRCPGCGKFMLEVKGKKGKMLICQDRECGFRKSIARTTNARCPECHKKLELKGEGKGRVFVCACGYREKLSSFEERKRTEKDKVSEKEVSRFLQQQKKSDEKPINTALADALAKFKKNGKT